MNWLKHLLWSHKVFVFVVFYVYIFYNLFMSANFCPENYPTCNKAIRRISIPLKNGVSTFPSNPVRNSNSDSSIFPVISESYPDILRQSQSQSPKFTSDPTSALNKKTLTSSPNHTTSTDVIKKYHSKTVEFRHQFKCGSILDGSESEIQRVQKYHESHRPQNGYPVTDLQMVKSMFHDCDYFKRIRGYVMEAGSPEEEEFPIAYVILAHLDFDHLERLLRVLYRPQNVFCIHLDRKVSDDLKQAVSGLASCFPNVILASHPQDVIYAHVSRLLADMGCMKDLLELQLPWKYLINMAATGLPLRSNRETVQILKVLNGKNDIHEVFANRIPRRWEVEYEIKKGRLKPTTRKLAPPPHNLTIVKGQAYNTYSREFLRWTFNNSRAQDLLEWSRQTYSPDEHYWATLNNLYHNPILRTPGGFRDHPDRKGFITMIVSWVRNTSTHICQGRSVHNICLLASGDLNYITHTKSLTANKFDLLFDPVAYSCMEEWFENKTMIASFKDTFDLSFYKRLYFIRYDKEIEKKRKKLEKERMSRKKQEKKSTQPQEKKEDKNKNKRKR